MITTSYAYGLWEYGYAAHSTRVFTVYYILLLHMIYHNDKVDITLEFSLSTGH